LIGKAAAELEQVLSGEPEPEVDAVEA